MKTDQSPQRYRARDRIAARLRRARVANDQTLHAAAAKMGVCVMKWQRWETGAQSIPAELLPEVAQIVDLTPAQLLKAA